MPVTDDFNRSGGLGTGWGVPQGSWAMSGNDRARPNGNNTVCMARRSSHIWPPNHYAEAVTATMTAVDEVGVMCRYQSGLISCYMFRGTTGGGKVVRCVNGTETVLATTGGFASGDTIRLTCTGSTLEAHLNGTLMWTGTDTALNGGWPGICGLSPAVGSGISSLTSWAGDGLGTVAGNASAKLPAASMANAACIVATTTKAQIPTAVVGILWNACSGVADGRLPMRGETSAGVLASGTGNGRLALHGAAVSGVRLAGGGTGAFGMRGTGVLSNRCSASGGGKIVFVGNGGGAVRIANSGRGVLPVRSLANGAAAVASSGAGRLSVRGASMAGARSSGVGGGVFGMRGTGVLSNRCSASGAGRVALAGSGSGAVQVAAAASGRLLLRWSASGSVANNTDPTLEARLAAATVVLGGSFLRNGDINAIRGQAWTGTLRLVEGGTDVPLASAGLTLQCRLPLGISASGGVATLTLAGSVTAGYTAEQVAQFWVRMAYGGTSRPLCSAFVVVRYG